MPAERPLSLTKNDVVLFIGDSITDCGQRDDPDRLGHGYVRMVHHRLAAGNPTTLPAILNHGHSGNTILDLQDRWENDVLAVAPTVLSIKIGVNDVWRQLDGQGRGVPVDEYTDVYRTLLTQTRGTLPDVRLVLCEPTVIDSPPQPKSGNDILRSYLETVRTLAADFDAIVVGMFGAIADARDARPDLLWTNDGVHPTPLGHTLLANTWLNDTGALS
ncbi:MAG: SGNH/GDSL hydrolase family protein [Planctomycetota bacterium]